MTQGVFIGFLPKVVASAPEDLAAAGVQCVCSVSECISSAPIERVEAWTHNEAGLYDEESSALEVVPTEAAGEHDLFAYRILPLAFEPGVAEEAWEPRERWPRLPSEPDLGAYEVLGYDVVGWGETEMFECSPLSCDGLAEELPVNRFCLLDELDDAVALGRRLADDEASIEPAIYHVVEVLRRRRA